MGLKTRAVISVEHPWIALVVLDVSHDTVVQFVLPNIAAGPIVWGVRH